MKKLAFISLIIASLFAAGSAYAVAVFGSRSGVVGVPVSTTCSNSLNFSQSCNSQYIPVVIR
jgi:hypothetical protein